MRLIYTFYHTAENAIACFFKNSLIIYEDQTNEIYVYWVHVLTIDKDKFAVLDKFLASFYVLRKVNFQNYFTNMLNDA